MTDKAYFWRMCTFHNLPKIFPLRHVFNYRETSGRAHPLLYASFSFNLCNTKFKIAETTSLDHVTQSSCRLYFTAIVQRFGRFVGLKGGRTSSGAWAGSVARGFISETKLATELEQRPTERPMPLQHAAENSWL